SRLAPFHPHGSDVHRLSLLRMHRADHDFILRSTHLRTGVPQAQSARCGLLRLGCNGARGAFKFLAQYLDLSPDGCATSTSGWTAWTTSLCMTAFTSLVLVWYVLSLVKAYVRRLRRQ